MNPEINLLKAAKGLKKDGNTDPNSTEHTKRIIARLAAGTAATFTAGERKLNPP